jgi:hypothetical protein
MGEAPTDIKTRALPEVRQITAQFVATIIPSSTSQSSRVTAITGFVSCQPPSDDTPQPSYIEYPLQYPRDYKTAVLSAAILIVGLQVIIFVLNVYGLKIALINKIGPFVLAFYLPSIVRDSLQYYDISIMLQFAAILAMLAFVIPAAATVLMIQPNETNETFRYYYGQYTSSIRKSDKLVVKLATFIDMTLGIIASGMDGIRTNNVNACRPFSYTMLFMACGFLIYHVFLRPYVNKFETISAIGKCLLQVIMCLIACVATYGNVKLFEVINILGTINILYLPIEYVIIRALPHIKTKAPVTMEEMSCVKIETSNKLEEPLLIVTAALEVELSESEIDSL